MLCEMVNRRQHRALVCAPGKGWLLCLAFQILQHFFLIPDSHYNSSKWMGLAYCDPPFSWSGTQDPKGCLVCQGPEGLPELRAGLGRWSWAQVQGFCGLDYAGP